MSRQSRLVQAYAHCELDRAKECPFCGSHILALIDDGVGPVIPTRQWRVFCGNCGVKGPQESTKDLAIDRWNGESHRSIRSSFIVNRPPVDRERGQ